MLYLRTIKAPTYSRPQVVVYMKKSFYDSYPVSCLVGNSVQIKLLYMQHQNDEVERWQTVAMTRSSWTNTLRHTTIVGMFDYDISTVHSSLLTVCAYPSETQNCKN